VLLFHHVIRDKIQKRRCYCEPIVDGFNNFLLSTGACNPSLTLNGLVASGWSLVFLSLWE
jgi:hypothetical protein